jgi:hypothetical protein
MRANRFPLSVALAAVLVAGCSRVLPGPRGLRLHYVIAVAEDAGHGARVTIESAGQPLRLLLPPNGPRRVLEPLVRPEGSRKETPLALSYRVVAPEAPHGGVGFACYRGFELRRNRQAST